MAFDGILMHSLCFELNNTLKDGRINKIVQPEKEELLITVNTQNGNKRLLISANPSLPFLYLTDANKPAPITAPAFCMLLRKHIGAGRIIEITQPSLERVICFKIQHLNDMGDIVFKKLYIEIMGKHSNIIFCDEDDMILDAIKHVSSAVSSVREVLPGRKYFIPSQEGKIDPIPISLTKDGFIDTCLLRTAPIGESIFKSLIGISPVLATEICYRAGIDPDSSTASLSDTDRERLSDTFSDILKAIRTDDYKYVVYKNESTGEPKEYGCIPLTIYNDYTEVTYETISSLLEEYYAQKNTYTNIRAKSADLRKLLSTHIERTVKKLELQKKQLNDTDKRDKYKVYGELLHTYGYSAQPGDKSITVTNYYDNSELTIPLDENLSAAENAKKYFDKYSKLKRTAEALDTFINQSESELETLKSIEASLLVAENESDLFEVKKELENAGFIKKHISGKKAAKPQKSKPLHFIDDNGFHIYVGKNNFQNDELTFKFATGNDWWFHTKKIHGSHVIVKSEGKELPDSTFETAGALAAYYSMARDTKKVEIDYLQKKNVKKPAGAAPGFVVYYSNYSLIATPSLKNVKQVE